MYVATK